MNTNDLNTACLLYTSQWASEFLRLYPSANILVTTKKDFETHNRKKFCARIATGDYDAIIMGHSQFEDVYKRQTLPLSGAAIKEGKTSPPKHFTEDTLLSAMETAGKDDMPDDAERKGPVSYTHLDVYKRQVCPWASIRLRFSGG